MATVPILKDAESRKKSIIENTPAIFNIQDNPAAVGKASIYEIEVASEVVKWCGLIIQISQRYKIEPNLVMAILYMETTHGWYDKFYPLRKTIQPMNLHYHYWRQLGVTKETLKCPFYNIEFGVILISRIKERIEKPTVRKIATIYNFLGAEKVTEYGARVEKVYMQKPWTQKGCAV